MKLKTRDFIFVAIQFFLFIVYLFDIKSWSFTIKLGFQYLGLTILGTGILISVVSLLQLNKNVSTFPSPKSNTQLIQNGLYRYVRHPIYTGILLITFGFALYAGSLFKFLICIGLFIVFYYKSSYEEQRLAIVFPNYDTYKKYAGRFFPKFW